MEELEETNANNTTRAGGDGSHSEKTKKTKKTRKTKSSTADDDDASDRITSLPEPVLLEILSLVPTKDLVKLMPIPRLGNLWPNVHSLFFHYNAYDGWDGNFFIEEPLQELCRSFWNLVRNVLMLHERPTINKFHLEFFIQDPPEYCREKWLTNEIDACVRFAVKKKVQVFKLEFLVDSFDEDCDERIQCKVLSGVFRLSSLTELKLRFCEIKLVGKVSLPLLRTLSLVEATGLDEHMTEILDACPLLENLSLINCYWMNKLEITHSNMKAMTVESNYGVKLCCPNLISLSVIIAGENIEGWDFLDISSLENVRICALYCSNLDKELMIFFIDKLRHTVDIKLCQTCAEVLMRWNWPKLASPLFEWKSVELELSLTSWLLPEFSRFVASSPYLETLVLHICDASYLGSWDGDKMIGKSGMAVDNCWNSNDASFCFFVHHLKTIRVSSFTTGPAVFLLLKLILQNAVVLEKMVISIKNPAAAGKRLKICQQLLGFRRASNRAVIHFS